MSEKEETEMVTIEVPLEWAEERASRGKDDGIYAQVDDTCRKALAARKTKYERWKEDLSTVNNPVWARQLLEKRGWSNTTAKLMAAAPQLLEALIALHALAKRRGAYDPLDHDVDCKAVVAIAAALPKDVADEVLDITLRGEARAQEKQQ